MIVIGIDPGLARLGYGVIEVSGGKITGSMLWMCGNIRKELSHFRKIIKNIYRDRKHFLRNTLRHISLLKNYSSQRTSHRPWV